MYVSHGLIGQKLWPNPRHNFKLIRPTVDFQREYTVKLSYIEPIKYFKNLFNYPDQQKIQSLDFDLWFNELM